RFGISIRQTLRDPVHFRLSGTRTRPWSQSSESLEHMGIAPLLRGSRDEWKPKIRVKRKSHAFRHDADDRRRFTVNAERLSEHPLIRTIPALPKRVAENDDALRVSAVFTRNK